MLEIRASMSVCMGAAPPPVPPDGPPEPPEDPGMEQGLWGHVPADKLIGRFLENPTAGGGARSVCCVPPAADGLNAMPAEPGELGRFCMVGVACREARLSSECIEWVAEPRLNYCGIDESGWDCRGGWRRRGEDG